MREEPATAEVEMATIMPKLWKRGTGQQIRSREVMRVCRWMLRPQFIML